MKIYWVKLSGVSLKVKEKCKENAEVKKNKQTSSQPCFMMKKPASSLMTWGYQAHLLPVDVASKPHKGPHICSQQFHFRAPNIS